MIKLSIKGVNPTMKSTERYDGKTRKDDIKKWTIITVIAVVSFVGLQVGLHFLKKANAADYVIVDMTEGRLKEDAQEHIKQIAGNVIGDKNGNGTVKVSIKSIMSGFASDYTESAAAMFTGDYILFFMTDPEPWDEDILIEKIDLTDTPLYQEWEVTNPGMRLYACILNAKDEEVEEAQRIVDAILNEDTND
jgi:hypothetical protein